MDKVTVRTPLRLTLFGGGCDNPAYYRQYGCVLGCATIDRYITVMVRPGMRTPGRWDIDAAGHVRDKRPNPYAIAAGWTDRDEVTIESPVQAGSGLGGSGALMVALLKARWPELVGHELAEATFNLERYHLGEPCGRQDHAAAAFGGASLVLVNGDGGFAVQSIALPDGLESRLALFWTGLQRSAGKVLQSQVDAIQAKSDGLAAMREIDRIGRLTYNDILSNNGQRYGELTEAHWTAKKCSGSTTTPEIDEWHRIGIEAGAGGGKVCGAGRGGYMLFVVEPDRRERLIGALTAAGLEYSPFRFTSDKAEIIE
jgi:D-glycero-alpha-D-manno-heptose-7-phosphate kinase